MVTINGRLLDDRHVELAERVPPGEDAIQVRQTESEAATPIGLLTSNPASDFLRDEPDLHGG